MVKKHGSLNSKLPKFQPKTLLPKSIGLQGRCRGEWSCWAYFCVNEDRLYPIFLFCIDFIRLKSDGSGIFARALCVLFCSLVLIKCGIVLDVL